MPESLPTDRSEPLTWDLSPTDHRATALLRYLPFAFVGGYVGIVVLAGALTLPALVANPELLGLVVVLALVGGPLSLLYLWPMLRDADQRPPLDPRGWFEGLSPPGALLAAVLGTAIVAVGGVVLGGVAHPLLVVSLAFPFFLLGLFDGEGRLDPETGTLTYREYTTDLRHVASVRTARLGSVTVVWLRYVAGASGPKPRLFVLPETVTEDVVSALRAGAATAADVEQRDPDRIAQAVLVAIGLLFFAVAAAVFLTDVATGVGTYVTFVVGALGVVFLAAARYAA